MADEVDAEYQGSKMDDKEEEVEPVEPEPQEALPLRAEIEEGLPLTDVTGGLNQTTPQVNILTNLFVGNTTCTHFKLNPLGFYWVSNQFFE